MPCAKSEACLKKQRDDTTELRTAKRTGNLEYTHAAWDRFHLRTELEFTPLRVPAACMHENMNWGAFHMMVSCYACNWLEESMSCTQTYDQPLNDITFQRFFDPMPWNPSLSARQPWKLASSPVAIGIWPSMKINSHAMLATFRKVFIYYKREGHSLMHSYTSKHADLCILDATKGCVQFNSWVQLKL